MWQETKLHVETESPCFKYLMHLVLKTIIVCRLDFRLYIITNNIYHMGIIF
jgi:hypothetical protein